MKLTPFFFLLFTYLMFRIIWPYTSWETDVDFLITKQHLIHLDYYRIAFYIHIFSSLIVLASGVILFADFFLKKFPAGHRAAGKLYVLFVLLLSAPSGLVLGLHANGGWLAQLSFVLLSPLWWMFTWKGYQTARQRNFKAHRIWMMRSFAITLSAISLRLYQWGANAFWFIDPEQLYIFLSWWSWVGNLIFLEGWWFFKKLVVPKFAFRKAVE